MEGGAVVSAGYIGFDPTLAGAAAIYSVEGAYALNTTEFLHPGVQSDVFTNPTMRPLYYSPGFPVPSAFQVPYFPPSPSVFPDRSSMIEQGARILGGPAFAGVLNLKYWEVGGYMNAAVERSMSSWQGPQQFLANNFPSLLPGAPKTEPVKDEEQKAIAALQDQNQKLIDENEKLRAALEQIQSQMKPA